MGTNDKTGNGSKSGKGSRRKISGGGPWDGDLWAPQGATEEAAARAEQYHNTIIDDKSIAGMLYKGEAFGGKDVFYVVDKKERRVLLPEHGGLMRDCGIAIDKEGDGVAVEIEYKGGVEIQKGRWKGNTAHAYDLFVID
jgi:hypothetical protein